MISIFTWYKDKLLASIYLLFRAFFFFENASMFCPLIHCLFFWWVSLYVSMIPLWWVGNCCRCAQKMVRGQKEMSLILSFWGTKQESHIWFKLMYIRMRLVGVRWGTCFGLTPQRTTTPIPFTREELEWDHVKEAFA